jgi:hypothetical protein
MMAQFWLVVVDTTGIQGYVFGSNRLRENVGASHLVHLATEGWLHEHPETLLPARHNIVAGARSDATRIERDELDAELIYAGGGNTVLLFNRQEDARRFANALSARLLCEAPGLEAVLVSEPFDWDGSLAEAMHKAMLKLAAKKADREWSHPLLGLSVSAACQSTGLPANWEEPEPGEADRKQIISAEVAAKWGQNEPARRRLKRVLYEDQEPPFALPNEFENLGRSEGEVSYIAVVHADGNGMGKVLEQIQAKFANQTGEANRHYIEKMRDFSDKANRAGVKALHAVVEQVEKWKTDGTISAQGDYLPLRPLVYGGDDVTFVCDGRIGLATAQTYLAAFAQQMIPDAEGQERRGTAAAGVAIVKVRYPFARAYQFSERLCKNAKDAWERKVPALDWHLAQSGLFGSLGEIRAHEYGEKREGARVQSSLLTRPLALEALATGDWQTWANFTTLLTAFQDRQAWPRNKVMALREALRDGSEAVESFCANYMDKDLPAMTTLAAEYRRTGWAGGRCVYFDAIEMIDQEVPA